MLSSLFALKMQTRKDQQTIYKVFYARKAYTNENFKYEWTHTQLS